MSGYIETFPKNIEVVVLDCPENHWSASRSGSLNCETTLGERMRIDFMTSDAFPFDRLAELIGKRVMIGHVSTAEYFANDISIIAKADGAQS